jgi:hypothetical protein
LSIDTTPLPSATIGSFYGGIIGSSGGTGPYGWSIASGSLPAGLTLDPQSGLISGYPTAVGTYDFTVSEADASTPTGQTASAPFSIVVATPAPPNITTTALAAGIQGLPYADSIDVTGGTGPLNWTVSSGALPDGLSLDPSTGAVSGTPSGSGTSTFTVTVTDSANPTPSVTSASLSIAVAPTNPLGISTTSLVDGVQGASYADQIDAGGGVAGYTFAVASGALPQGITLSPSDGSLYGTPLNFGFYSFTVTVTDGSTPTQTASQTFGLTVDPGPPLSMGATSLPAGAQGKYYSQSLQLSGGVGDYTVSVTSGSLPDGLSLDQYGNVYGEITSSLSTTATISVTDQASPVPQSITRTFAFSVTPSPLKLTSTIPSPVQGEYFDQSVAVSGGSPGFTWIVISNSLPPGLSFSNGEIYGSTTKLGTFSITVQLSDSSTPKIQLVKAKIKVKVVAPPKMKIITKKIPFGNAGQYYDQVLSVTGGSPGYTWTVISGSLPAGLALASNGVIYGYPAVPGAFKFTTQVTDSGLPLAHTATQAYVLKVGV